MEVHYHPKHSEKPKKIKEYLSEFIIIFFAVTAGFFAENLREYFVDKHKEHEYIKGLVQDLKSDIQSLDKIIPANERQAAGLDSLLHVMRNQLSDDDNNKFQYYAIRYTLEYTGFIPSKGTITQLNNTGELRLIKEDEVSQGIVSYDNALTSINTQFELLANQITKLRDKQTEIIDFLSIMNQSQGQSPLKLKAFPALLKNDKLTIHTYYFNTTFLKGVVNSYSRKLQLLRKQSLSLLQLIEQKYGTE